MTSPSEKLAGILRERFPDRLPGGDPAAERAADMELIRTGALTDAELASLYGEVWNSPVVEDEEKIHPERFSGLSAEFINAHTCLPLEWDEETIQFLVADPYSTGQISFVAVKSLKRTASFRFARRSFLERLISEQLNGEKEEELESRDADDEVSLRNMAGEARIVRLVNDIFTRAIELGASDIHVEPGHDRVSVRCRIDGLLTEIMTSPLNQFPAIASRIKLLGGLNIAESRLPQDGRTNVRLGKETLDMRISTIPILTGESIVLRLLNQESVRFDLRTLGMSDAHLEQFRKLIQIPHGMILVVGPTGSGKTTTLYSVISRLNDRKRKIITIEDPVEYRMEGLCQMQVNPKIDVTFASGLRHIVRQDPDIILVGEIRDRETADIAVNAALTGHLVLSTLHTNDAVGAVTRLLDMGMESFLVSSALYGVLSQRLVRKICPVCSGTGKDPDGARCRKCGGSGYKGRCGIFELLTLDDELRYAISRNAPSSELEEIAVRHGMVTLRQDGLDKVKNGVTTMEELSRSASES